MESCRTDWPPSGEGAVLAVMAAHDNDFVRAMAGRAAFLIGLSDTAAGLDLLSKIEFRGSWQVAAGALSGFVLQGQLNWSVTAMHYEPQY